MDVALQVSLHSLCELEQAYRLAPPASGETMTQFSTSIRSRICLTMAGSAYSYLSACITTSSPNLRLTLSTGTSKNPWIWDACRSIVCYQLRLLICSKTHDDVVTSSFSEHVGDQLGGNRGSGLVFLILTSVGEVGKDSGDSTGRGNLILVAIYWKMLKTHFTSVDHDTQLHQ